MNSLHHVPLVVCVLALACSNDGPENPSNGAGGGGAGASGSGAGSVGSAGSAGASECFATGTHIKVALDPDPIGYVEQEWETVGAVTAASKNAFTVDTCPPNSGCSSTSLKVTITAPGLDTVLPVGAFVRLRVVTDVYNNGSFATIFSVRNVPMWQGMTNPVGATERWYLLTTDESLKHPDAPFEVSSRELECPGPLQGGKGRLYDVVFTDPEGSATTLAHDQEAVLNLGGQRWNVQVLRAFESYNYDSPIAFSWYASWAE